MVRYHKQMPILVCFNKAELRQMTLVLEALYFPYAVKTIRSTNSLWQRPKQIGYEIWVYEKDRDNILTHWSALQQEEQELQASIRKRAKHVLPSLFEPQTIAFLVGLLALWIMIFLSFGPGHSSSGITAQLSLRPQLVFGGQWHRLITSTYMHADLAHLSGNIAFAAVFFIGLSNLIGPGKSLFFWQLTASIGMLATASYHLNDAYSSIGASGGVYGLFGMIASYHIRYVRTYFIGLSRKIKTMGLIGAAFGIFAWTAFSPNADLVGHIAGFAAGLSCGWFMPFERTSLHKKGDTLFTFFWLVLFLAGWARFF